ALSTGVAREGGSLAALDGGEVVGGLLEEVDHATGVAVLLGAESQRASGFVRVPRDDIAASDPTHGRADAVGVGRLPDAALLVHEGDRLGLPVGRLDDHALCLVLGCGLSLAGGAAALLGCLGACALLCGQAFLLLECDLLTES